MTINNYLKKERLFLLSSILSLCYLVSCQKQPNVNFGSTYVGDNNGANIVVVDTSTIAVSTVYVDSTATAGTGFLQVGTVTDPYFGTITSRAFLQIAPPASASVGVNDLYDSIGLILLFKKGNPFYGDSTQPQTINVNQVDSLYQLGSFQNGFNSRSSLPLSSTLLGSAQNLIIAPNIPYTSQGSGDTVKIKLDDALGQELFQMIYNKSDTIFTPAQWLAWFHGLCISPDPSSKGAIYGFKDSAVMRIYYNKAGVVGVPAYIDFGITNKTLQFNNIVADRSTSHLKNLIQPVNPNIPQIPPATRSDTMFNAGYVQTSTGLNVKLTFPYLNAIALRPDFLRVLRAQLTVRPDLNSFNTNWPLPTQLGIYNTDLNNLIGAPLAGGTGIQNGNLTVDYLHEQNMVYTYDITSFITAQITNNDPTAIYKGLMLSVPSPGSTTSFNRLVVADATYPVNQRITLNIYYISLYPHN